MALTSVFPCADVRPVQVGSAGGIGAILRGMAAFPSEADIQGEGCTAVTNLSHNCDRNRRYVVEGGGLVLILNAMQVPYLTTTIRVRNHGAPAVTRL